MVSVQRHAVDERLIETVGQRIGGLLVVGHGVTPPITLSDTTASLSLAAEARFCSQRPFFAAPTVPWAALATAAAFF